MKWLRDLLLFVTALILVVGTAWLFLASSLESQAPPAERPSTTWTGVVPPSAVEDAARRAGDRAGSWQSDAQLVRVEATWRPGPDRLDVEIVPVAWSFYYYSPSTSRVASAAVNSNDVFWVPPVWTENAPLPLEPFPPAHGARSAWLAFRGAGGEDFIRTHPEATVTFVLRAEEEGMFWRVFATSEEHHLQVRIDAESGLVIP
jgi:hypothetical protein